MIISPIKVEYIDHLGSDDTVVDTARVSFNKNSSLYTKEQNAKLIYYLAKHGHWSPFSHCFLSFRIKAPLFVARQLQKHTVGLSWNEVSRRYVDTEPEFYIPDVWRGRAENAKQGSEGVIESIWWIPEDSYYSITTGVEEITFACLRRYNQMIKEGVCPEQARMVLPQNTHTEWIWSGSLTAFARVINLRLDPHSQYETSIVAQQIKSEVSKWFPISWEALSNS